MNKTKLSVDNPSNVIKAHMAYGLTVGKDRPSGIISYLKYVEDEQQGLT